MIKTRMIPLAAAAILIITLIISPLFIVKASASSLSEIFADAKTRGGTYKAALMDADYYDSENGVLTESEENALLSLMQETAEKIRCNVGIVITHDLKNMNPERYNANFSTAVFGAYTDSATLLLLNRHGNTAYINLGYTDDLFFSDRADTLFTNNSKGIFNRINKALDRDEDDFAGACSNFCAALTSYGSGMGRITSTFNIDGTTVIMVLIFGTFSSFFIVSVCAKGYKRKTPISAAHYIDKGRTKINRQVDQFVREYTTSVHLSSSSSGHSGGSRGGGHSSGHHSSHHSGRGR